MSDGISEMFDRMEEEQRIKQRTAAKSMLKAAKCWQDLTEEEIRLAWVEGGIKEIISQFKLKNSGLML